MKIEFFVRQGEFRGLICSRNKLFSRGQNILSMTKTFCLGQNILSMTKKFISATCKSLKITFPDEKVHFYSKEVIFMDSCTVETNFLAMDRIFYP